MTACSPAGQHCALEAPTSPLIPHATFFRSSSPFLSRSRPQSQPQADSTPHTMARRPSPRSLNPAKSWYSTRSFPRIRVFIIVRTPDNSCDNRLDMGSRRLEPLFPDCGGLGPAKGGTVLAHRGINIYEGVKMEPHEADTEEQPRLYKENVNTLFRFVTNDATMNRSYNNNGEATTRHGHGLHPRVCLLAHWLISLQLLRAASYDSWKVSKVYEYNLSSSMLEMVVSRRKLHGSIQVT